MKVFLLLMAATGVVGIGWWLFSPGLFVAAATSAGLMETHDKLGWLDDVELTAADFARIRALSGQGFNDNLGVIRSIQSGTRGAIVPRDFELLRQDRRRARAAYPEVSEDDLYQGTWLSVDVSARVPDSFCTSGNSNGTKVGDKWYLDGGCHVSVVKPLYTQRADVVTTQRVLTNLKDQKQQKWIARLARWGYSGSSSGTGGSQSVHCYPDPLPSNVEPDDLHIAGQCVIVLDEKEKYVFPFVIADWINPPWGKDNLRKLAAAKGVTAVAYEPAAPKPWVIRDGALARGQTGAPGRLYRSMWNSDRDDYDNTDIGPDDPASWVTDGIFGMVLGFVPAPDNGERHSDPTKPWYLVISYYGYPAQVSGGWTEEEAKAALPKFSTGMTYPMDGRDFASANRGNLQEARCTQLPPSNGQMLKDRTLPVRPAPEPQAVNYVPYSPGMTLMPGQSTSIGVGR